MPGITIAFFSVGGRFSDLAAAQSSRSWHSHHEIKFTIQEGLDAVKDVIYNLETYDVTTIRASTPMWLMARVIKSMGLKWYYQVKEQMNFGGYLYFHKAPNAQDFTKKTFVN
jgi:asparagine synthase (glutamine-hydrolysing)